MPLARLGGQVLFFAHVPKTGGTSVEAYLRAQGAALALHGAGEGWSRVPLQHLHRAAWEEIVAPGAWDARFDVLRDPLARLVSEFRMRVEPMRPKLRPAGLARMALNRAAGRATHAVRIGGRIEYLDFDAWAARMLEASRRDPWTQSNHMRPQAEFVDPAFRVFRFEDGLEPVFRWIDAAFGLPAAQGAFHERRSAAIEVSCGPETEARVRDFYAADYALLEEAGR
jgi:hypothetical protein